MQNEINNGYVILLHYGDDTNPRVFGPFRTPAEALRDLPKGMDIVIYCDEPERPVISKRYKVEPSIDGPLYVTIEALERWQLFARS